MTEGHSVSCCSYNGAATTHGDHHKHPIAEVKRPKPEVECVDNVPVDVARKDEELAVTESIAADGVIRSRWQQQPVVVRPDLGWIRQDLRWISDDLRHIQRHLIQEEPDWKEVEDYYKRLRRDLDLLRDDLHFLDLEPG